MTEAEAMSDIFTCQNEEGFSELTVCGVIAVFSVHKCSYVRILGKLSRLLYVSHQGLTLPDPSASGHRA